MLAQRGQNTQAHTVTVTRPLFFPNPIKFPLFCMHVCVCAMEVQPFRGPE